MHTRMHLFIHACIFACISSSKCCKLGQYTDFCKTTGACPNRGGPQFAIPLFSHYSNKDMMSSVEDFLNRSYVRFESTSTATTACIHTVTTHACHNAHYLATNQREHDLYIIQIQTNSETD